MCVFHCIQLGLFRGLTNLILGKPTNQTNSSFLQIDPSATIVIFYFTIFVVVFIYLLLEKNKWKCNAHEFHMVLGLMQTITACFNIGDNEWRSKGGTKGNWFIYLWFACFCTFSIRFFFGWFRVPIGNRICPFDVARVSANLYVYIKIPEIQSQSFVFGLSPTFARILSIYQYGNI